MVQLPEVSLAVVVDLEAAVSAVEVEALVAECQAAAEQVVAGKFQLSVVSEQLSTHDFLNIYNTLLLHLFKLNSKLF